MSCSTVRRYAALLHEIRAALACQTAEPATFRRLAAALSAPALGLLLFLGGAASVGCGDSGLHAQAQDAGPPDASTVTNCARRTRRRPRSVMPRSPKPTLTSHDIMLPDAPPAEMLRPLQMLWQPVSPMGAAVTIQDIMDSCNIPDQTQQQVLACLAKLGDSWSGLGRGTRRRRVAMLLSARPWLFCPVAVCRGMVRNHDFVRSEHAVDLQARTHLPRGSFRLNGHPLDRVAREPHTCIFEITRRCNLRCIHCENQCGEVSRRELPTERIRGVARELVQLGCHQVDVTGGEPLLHPDWERIVSRFRRGWTAHRPHHQRNSAR